jgi:3-hydroxymyristoyl/3-hydroxydecanoyl-(acyl carrier protein) dehydratase
MAQRGLEPEIVSERFDAKRAEQALVVPETLACLPGHFPGRPIVPGVLQVHWAMALAARWLGGAPWPRRIEALKFKSPLLAGQRATLALERDDAASEVRFELSHGETVFSLGRLVLEADA